MRIWLSTAPPASRLKGAGGGTVDNRNQQQGLPLRNPKTCPNKPGHLWVSRSCHKRCNLNTTARKSELDFFTLRGALEIWVEGKWLCLALGLANGNQSYSGCDLCGRTEGRSIQR